MLNYKIFELPATTQKSYYGKAVIFHNNKSGKIYLKSYDTFVCSIDRKGNFRRHWGGYSLTTMTHIKDFCKLYGIPAGNKKWWCSLPVKAAKEFNQPTAYYYRYDTGAWGA